jgi:hypothetical protein
VLGRERRKERRSFSLLLRDKVVAVVLLSPGREEGRAMAVAVAGRAGEKPSESNRKTGTVGRKDGLKTSLPS